MNAMHSPFLTVQEAAAEQQMLVCLAQETNVDLSRAYREAMEIVPDLVRRETPLQIFLRRDKYEPAAAARRLLMYWKWRREVFGDRALLPLTQNGRGALTDTNIELLRSGMFTFVPRGRHMPALLYMDLSMLNRVASADIMQWLFYFATHSATDPTLQEHGLVFVHVSRDGHRMEMIPAAWQAEATALPIKVLPKIILLSVVDPDKKCLEEYLTSQALQMIKYNNGKQPRIVEADSVAKRLQTLETLDIPSNVLPTRYGGTLDADQWHSDYIRMRISLEEAAQFNFMLPLVVVLGVPPITASWHQQQQVALPKSQQQLTPQQQKRLEHMNDGYALRKRRKKQVTLAQVQAAVQAQRDQKEALLRSHRCLEDALAKARDIVALHIGNIDTRNQDNTKENDNPSLLACPSFSSLPSCPSCSSLPSLLLLPPLPDDNTHNALPKTIEEQDGVFLWLDE